MIFVNTTLELFIENIGRYSLPTVESCSIDSECLHCYFGEAISRFQLNPAVPQNMFPQISASALSTCNRRRSIPEQYRFERLQERSPQRSRPPLSRSVNPGQKVLRSWTEVIETRRGLTFSNQIDDEHVETLVYAYLHLAGVELPRVKVRRISTKRSTQRTRCSQQTC